VGGVERGDVPGGVHPGLLDLPLAHHRPAAAGDRGVRGLERAAYYLQDGQAGQGMGVPGRRQRQGGIGRVEVPAPGRRQAHRVTCTVPNSVASSLP